MWLAMPLQFRAHAAEDLSPRRHPGTGEGFGQPAVCGRVADRRVAGERLHVMDGPCGGPAGHRPFDAAVLIAQRDLQVEHGLTVALETEVSRFDDPAWTGPTATSWTSGPSIRKKSVVPQMVRPAVSVGRIGNPSGRSA